MKKFSAKTLNDCLVKAANELKCDQTEMTYEIIEEKKGILGIGSSVTITAYCNEDIKEFIFEYLGEYFTEMNLETEIEISLTTEGFKVILNAENNAILIGKNGQTLQALNNVVRGACNNTFKKRINVYIDINNYKQDRYGKVKAIARRVAKTVQKTKVTAKLDPMPSDERKIVHQYLGKMANIRTESMGEGAERHLTIVYDENKVIE